MESAKIYSSADVENVVELYLKDSDRAKLDSILNDCAENYNALDIDAQINFKRNAKTFIRTYNFLSAILPGNSSAWEKLSIFLTLLVTKLPAPENDDETITENVNLENYRAVAQDTLSIVLANENAVVKPAPVPSDMEISEPEQDTLTHILNEFHRLFGDMKWTNKDSVDLQIKEIFYAAKKDDRIKNAMISSDEQNTKSEIVRSVRNSLSMTNDRDFYIAYNDGTTNKLGQALNYWLNDTIFQSVYNSKLRGDLKFYI